MSITTTDGKAIVKLPNISHNGTKIRLEQRSDGQLWLIKGEKTVAVTVKPCFPWTQPGKYISLRDHEDKEIVLINDASVLDSKSQEALELALFDVGFVLEIEHVDKIEEDFELVNWIVRTRQGKCKFQTKRDDWPRTIPGGGLLIKDVGSNLFYIDSLRDLDKKSRRVLRSFAD